MSYPARAEGLVNSTTFIAVYWKKQKLKKKKCAWSPRPHRHVIKSKHLQKHFRTVHLSRDSRFVSHAGRVSRCTHQFVWLGPCFCHVDQGCLPWAPGRRHSFHAHWDRLSSSLRRPSPQALNLSVGARFIAWDLRRPFRGNTDGASGILGNVRHSP